MRGGNAKINTLTISEIGLYIEREFEKIPCQIMFVYEEVTCNDMINTYNEHGVLKISALHNNSDIYTPLQNLKFRAIHDYVHLTKNYPCDYDGELKTYLYQSQGLSDAAKKVLYSEIVLQASYYLYFGVFAEKQKIVIVE